MKTLAVDIGGTKFTLAVFDDEKMIRREQRPTDPVRGRNGHPRRHGKADRRVAPASSPSTVAALASAVPLFFRRTARCPFHACRRLGQRAANRMAGGTCRELPPSWITTRTWARWASCILAPGKAASPLVYMTLSTGVGGGIVIDGQVLRGPDSWAGEIGHLNVEPEGPACLCGSNGCLERPVLRPLAAARLRPPRARTGGRRGVHAALCSPRWRAD